MLSPQGVRRRIPLALVLVAGMALLAVPATAGPDDRLDDVLERQQEVDRRQARQRAAADDLLSVISRLDAKREVAESKVDALDDELERLESRIDEVKADLQASQQVLTAVTEDLQDTLQRLLRRTDLLELRAIAAYKAGPTAYLDGLLSSEDLADVINKQTYYEAVLDSDARLVEEIEVLRVTTEARRDTAEAKTQEIADAKLQLEADARAVQRARAERGAVLADRADAVAAKENLLDKVRKKQAQLDQIERELEQDEAALRAALSGGASGPFPVGGGQLLWPAAGPVTSNFGPRVHPIFGDVRVHTGIDIGASYGAPVIAADSGTVAYVGPLGGYGNVIAIDHGGGLATTYNHLSAYSVSSGQSVSRGSTIGAVGCTGYCTGPHLHFEVRISGTPVDPLPYLQ